MSENAILQAKDLHLYYGETEALKGIDIAALVFAVLLCVGIGVLRHFGL